MQLNRKYILVWSPVVLALGLGAAGSSFAQTVSEIVPSAGPRGARVVVVGSSLANPNLSVHFTTAGGSASAPIFARTPTLIEVGVSTLAVSGPMHVKDGAETIATFNFTVTPDTPIVKVATLAASDKAHDVFKEPSGNFVFPTSGATYVADRKHHQIKLVRPDGSVIMAAGTGKSGYLDGPASRAQFAEPSAVVIDTLRNALYVSDTNNHVIRKVTLDGAVVSTLAGSGRPEDRDGTGAEAGFKQPAGLAIDAAGNLYVADGGNDKIRKVTPAGQVTTIAGAGRPGFGDGPAPFALFRQPAGIAMDPAGAIYISDSQNHVIRKLDENGMVTTVAGTSHGGHVDGRGSMAELKGPAGLAIDDGGNLLVADTKNNVVRKIAFTAPNVTVTTLAGSGKPGFMDGDPLSSEFRQPSGVDARGAIYIADTNNDAIRLLWQEVALTDLYPRTGDPGGGTTVRLFGSGFVPGRTEVRFGPIPAMSVSYVSSTEVLATVPPGTIGAADVTVTTSAGTAMLDDGFVYQQPFRSIFITPGAPIVDVGAALQVFAFGVTEYDEDVDITGQATWTTEIPAVAVVDVNGMAHGLSIGNTPVTVTYGSLSSTAMLTVIGYTQINLSAATLNLRPGENANLTAHATKSNGAVADVTAQATWTTSAPDIATVAAGAVTAVANGTAMISASFAGVASTATVVVSSEAIPGDPTLSAPEPDLTVAAPLADRVRFLYSGPDAIQRDVTPGAIRDERVTIIRGTVRARGGQPLPGARIIVLGHPEYGFAVSRADGVYDIALNGGGPVTLRTTKNGYIPSDRLLMTQWNQQIVGPDIVLVGYDTDASVIATNAATPQTARGRAVTDDDGTRRATLYVPAQTGASLVMDDGAIFPTTQLHVRATEFTVGADGPQAMPAALPPTSAYTYCVELSADEAVAAGAKEVRFTKPLSLYVENFLSFPAGTIVPLGYYDRAVGGWIGVENGRVLKILAISNGLASIDSNGDAQADDDQTLAALGIDAAERETLGTLYAAGVTLWRMRIPHFTPWDANWPYGPPAGATVPTEAQAEWIPAPSGDFDPTGKACGWSIVDCKHQVLSESIAIVGTPFTLEYNSARVARSQYKMTVRATGATVPANVKRIEVSFTVAGRSFKSIYAPEANIEKTLEWDGLDAYGKPVQGAATAYANVSYVYEAVYTQPTASTIAWGVPGTFGLRAGRVGADVTLGRTFTLDLGHFGMGESGFGDWSINAQAFYDGNGRAIYESDGSQRGGNSHGTDDLALYTLAGNGGCCDSGEGGSATSAELTFPISMAAASDGTVYLVDDSKIKKIAVDGTITTIAGISSLGFTPDGMPAAGNRIWPWDIALGPDDTLYFNDINNNRVRRIVNGILETVAGNGEFRAGETPNGVSATSVPVNAAGIAIGPDGTLYIAEGDIHMVGRDGILRVLARDADGTLNADRIAVGPDGSVYTTSGWLRTLHRVTPDGKITRIANNLRSPQGIAVASDGVVLVTERDGHVVTAFAPDGTSHTFAGNGLRTASPEGALARTTPASYPMDARIAPDGSVLLAISGENKFRKTAPVFPAAKKSGTVVPSSDGTVAHVFVDGRHVRTVDSLTGATLLTLQYDSGGRLVAITDGDGNVTTVERDEHGNATAIVAPGGQRTEITMTAGKLTRIANPAGEAHDFTYNDAGLLATLTDPRRDVNKFTYDDDGLLIKDEDPVGGFIALVRSGRGPDYTVTRSSAEGRVQSYSMSVGDDKTARRLHTGTDGLLRSWSRLGATTVVTQPDGTSITISRDGDPRFGAAAPVLASASMRLPSGLASATTSKTTAVLANPGDPLSLLSLTSETTVNSRRFTTTYARATNAITTTSAAGRTGTITLDTKGRPSELRIGTLTPLTYAYTTTGEIDRVTTGNRVLKFDYNTRYELTSTTDPLSRTVHFTYDDAGRLLTQTLPDGRVISFSYDADGNVTSVTPPSRPAHILTWTPIGFLGIYLPPAVDTPVATRYAYDRDRRLQLMTRADGTTLTPRYDAAGRMISLEAAGRTLSWTYDDNTGALRTASDSDGGSLTFTYDGPLLKSEKWTGTTSGTVSFGYDNSFRLSAESAAGVEILLSYDDDDLLTQAGSLLLRRDTASGLVTGTTLDGIVDEYAYNSFGEVTSYTARFGTSVIASFAYSRDDAGRITTQTTTIAGQSSTSTYAYDDAGHLESVVSDGSRTTYDYDSNGNRLARVRDGLTESGVYDVQDRLFSYAGATFEYNTNGGLVARNGAAGRTTFDYDPHGNLRAVAFPDGTRVEYVVDASDRRIGRKVNGVLTHAWLYSGQLRVIAELDGDGALVSRFVYATHTNVPDYMIRGGATYRIISDHLGSPRMVVNVASGALIQSLTYDEFGHVLADTNPGFQPFGYAGGLYDRSTGETRFGARDYDPQTGRWTTKDPIGFAGGDTNFYGYAFNDPINLVDPSGLDIWIEGPSPGEPAGHLSINVGDPAGNYSSYGFGVNDQLPGFYPGEVYIDTVTGGAFEPGYYQKTSALQDAAARARLDRIVGNRAPYRPSRTCRTFARDNFELLTRDYGHRSAPPVRRVTTGYPSSEVPKIVRPTVK